MKLADYREALGIGFCNDEKFQRLLNKLCVYVEQTACYGIKKHHYVAYCLKIGEPCYTYSQPSKHLADSLKKCTSISELLVKYIEFVHSFTNTNEDSFYRRDSYQHLIESLSDLNIPYETHEDEDGIYVFPKGAKELDEALISQPLDWLREYPDARKTFVIALKQYSEGIYIRDVADNLRKALEAFLQEFLGNSRNLESNKNTICQYLGVEGVDARISGLYHPLINTYKALNDRTAKHNDAVDARLLEFLLYQTGLLIRMVISVKKSS